MTAYSLKICVDNILPPCVDILSEDLCLLYAGTPSAHGLQSNLEDGSEDYNKQLSLCATIADCMRELVKIQKRYEEKIDEQKEL